MRKSCTTAAPSVSDTFTDARASVSRIVRSLKSDAAKSVTAAIR
jgi:hypothetical protein